MSKENNLAENTCTRITNNMVIDGGISSSDNLLIEGQVFGNVCTSADLTANNLIVGDIKANNMSFNSARIKGNIDIDGALAVGDSTVIVGDIKADALKLSGKVHGNINVNQYIILTNTALIVGDITASVVTTQAGSRINGTITTTANIPNDQMETEFDLGEIPDPKSDALYAIDQEPEVKEEPKQVEEVVAEETTETAEEGETTEGGEF